MKAIFLAFLLAICVANSTAAFTDDRLPVSCYSTNTVLELLKHKQFQLTIMGEVDNVQTLIFINPSNDMVVGLTVTLDQKSTTCIFIAGEKNTIVFDLPKQFKNEKEL